MAFDIKKERIRFRRHGHHEEIKWEIPELDTYGYAGKPSTALSAVRDKIRQLGSGAIDTLKARIEAKQVELAGLLNELAELESAEPSTLPELIAEQQPYLERALELLEPGAMFGRYEVQLVGVLDVGDEDEDSDLDFKVTLGW